MSTPTTPTTDAPAAAAAANAVVASTAMTATTSASTASTTVVTSTVTTTSPPKRTTSLEEWKKKWKGAHPLRDDSGKVTAIMTASGVHAYDGDDFPLDYGSDVEEGEDEVYKEALSPERKDSGVGSRRPREDDSDTSSSKRSRNDSERPLADAGALSTPRGGDDSTPSGDVASRTKPVRDPWMPSAIDICSRFGATVEPNSHPLYSCNPIVDDEVAVAKNFDSSTDQRRDYYIGLFHELRWFASKKTSRKSKLPEWQALCQSWSAFVDNFNRNPSGYRDRIRLARERFEKFSKRDKLDRLHQGAVEVGIPCAVPSGTACELCRPWAVRLSERDVNGYTGVRVPEELNPLRAHFIAQLSSSVAGNRNTQPSGVGNYNARSSAVGDYSARSSFTPFGRGSGGGLRTPSPFPERIGWKAESFYQ